MRTNADIGLYLAGGPLLTLPGRSFQTDRINFWLALPDIMKINI